MYLNIFNNGHMLVNSVNFFTGFCDELCEALSMYRLYSFACCFGTSLTMQVMR